MLILKNKQKVEAIKRMKAINMEPSAINDFDKNNWVHIYQDYGWSLYGQVLDQETEEIVKEWEKETNNLVYAVIKNSTNCGEILTFMYVSKYTEKWELDKQDLVEYQDAVCYVMNLSDPECSEFVHCGIECRDYCLKRTY